MAVRCTECDRLSRDEAVCEWCGEEIPVEERQLAAARAGGRETGGSAASAVVLADDDRRAEADQEPVDSGAGSTSASPVTGRTPAAASGSPADAVSREEARAAAAAVPDEEREADEVAAAVETEPEIEAIERRQDRDTLVILVLILVQLAITLYLGRLSSWWSITGILWLLVGWGVKQREGWSLALPGVLFALDIAFLLFGIGPRERAGLPDFAPLDFFLYVLRLTIWGLIWRLRDELA
jgi:hypothetical protein